MTQGARNIIAIDGPAGSGKSTAAHGLAARLGYVHVNSGAIYRCIAYAAIGNEVDLDDGKRVGKLAAALKIELVRDGNRPAKVVMNGVDRSHDIRTELISRTVPRVSEHAEVRLVADRLLRALGASDDLVCDGRDIGTSVFPDAKAKFWLDADLEVRARRCGQREEHVAERDRHDRERAHSPLRKAKDAFVLDTTRLSPELVVNILYDRSLPLLSR